MISIFCDISVLAKTEEGDRKGDIKSDVMIALVDTRLLTNGREEVT